MAYNHREMCSCWYARPGSMGPIPERLHLPQLEIEAHTTILSTSSRTTLKQTFANQSDQPIPEGVYTFPLYDGVSVVGFECKVGSKVLVGVVKEKQQARTDYKEAVAQGKTAGLLEQLRDASDIFRTQIGNIPAHAKVFVEITYLGELRHDAETDGSRFTIPTFIAPRYGALNIDSAQRLGSTEFHAAKGISITVDVSLENQVAVRGLQSPSHPIAVTMGRTSQMDSELFESNHASATLTLGTAELDKDFVIVVLAKGQDTPRALLESHPTIPNQRALMATLVPKFSLPNTSPEIVFVIDRSGSMEGKIHLVVQAMTVFLKSLPLGVKFNICSFGSYHSFLFPKSVTYDESNLEKALVHLKSFAADFGGTEMYNPIEATVKNRFKDMPLEVMVLTDGEIWNQQTLFDYLNKAVKSKARFFPLGIGHGASTALVEGIARAGDGFAQFVAEGEKLDKRLIRMLKAALTPQITNYTLEVKYGKGDVDAMTDDEFEMVESFASSTKDLVTDLKKPPTNITQKVISLFNPSAKEEPTNPPKGRYDDLPSVNVPAVLQAPHRIPSLYAFNRTTVYLLLGPNSRQEIPKSVVLRGTCEHGPIELEIPVQDNGKGTTIHQLAAKKAVHELEQGRGWLTEVRVDKTLLKDKYEGRWDLMVEREAVRIGVQFQVGGKWCSFIAVETDAENMDDASTLVEKAGAFPGLVEPTQQRLSMFSPSKPSPNPLPSISVSGNTSASSFPSWDAPDSWPTNYLANSTQGFTSTHMFGALGPSFGGPNHFSPSAAPASTTTGFGHPSTFSAPHFRRLGGADQAFAQPLFGGGGGARFTTSASVQSAAPAAPAAPINSGGLFGQSSSVSIPCFGAQPPAFGTPNLQQSMPEAFQRPSNTASVFGNSSSRPDLFAADADLLNSPGLEKKRKGRAPIMARVSTGGLPPRKQLASKAARISAAPAAAPAAASAMPPPPPGGSFFTRAELAGGEAFSLEEDIEEDEEESDEDMGFGLFDNGHQPSTKSARARRTKPQRRSIASFSNDERMHKLIEEQKFGGWWEADPMVMQLIGLSIEQLDQVNIDNVQKSKAQVQVTIAVIAWLKKVMSNDEDVWEMIVDKAEGWLEQQLGSGKDIDTLIGSTRALISA